tara:strand:- start:595 stop:801 length:207 start_codon:yes stop_codon:yes gene_type:complete
MKKIFIIILLLAFSSSVNASSCMVMAKAIDDKIAEVQKIRDEAMKAHEEGNHQKSDELFAKAMAIFKN